jgi:hypothetical protein
LPTWGIPFGRVLTLTPNAKFENSLASFHAPPCIYVDCLRSGVAPLLLLLLVVVSLAWVVCSVQQLRRPVAVFTTPRRPRTHEPLVVVTAVPLGYATERTPLRPQLPGEPALPVWATRDGSRGCGSGNGGSGGSGGSGSGGSRGGGTGGSGGISGNTEFPAATVAVRPQSYNIKTSGGKGVEAQASGTSRYTLAPSAPPDERSYGGV